MTLTSAEKDQLLFHALLVAGSSEDDLLVAAKKPAKSKRGAESQLETVLSNELLRAKPVVAEPL